MKEKEWLYIGFYFDILGRFILKIGTTNDLARRAQEHTRNYKRSKNYTMPSDSKFQYLWHIKLSKYNTLRYEDENRNLWKSMGVGEFIRNDRFYCPVIPAEMPVTIRKIYNVEIAAPIGAVLFFQRLACGRS